LHNNRPKRLKLRLSGLARKSQKRFRDTPRFKFQAVLARTQPFLSRSIEKRGDQSRFKCRKMVNYYAIRSSAHQGGGLMDAVFVIRTGLFCDPVTDRSVGESDHIQIIARGGTAEDAVRTISNALTHSLTHSRTHSRTHSLDTRLRQRGNGHRMSRVTNTRQRIMTRDNA
jgi:hypothetical protein